MAKGNLFLGTAAKSVGDVVMYRREGSQVSRVRVRKIANPKTDAQCEQRAFMSAVVKFYQPLANVLDRSWQGMSRAKSYAKFLKTNAAIVRAGGYYLPKDRGAYPLPLQLSNGTLMGVGFTFGTQGLLFDFSNTSLELASMSKVSDLSKLLVALGAQNGDVATFVFVSWFEGEGSKVDAPQFIIDTTSDVALSQALPTLAFGGDITEDKEVTVGSRVTGIASGSLILARNIDGEWKRSTSFLLVEADFINATTSAAAKAAAIASYKGAAASDNPLVYLDGDELENA